MIISRRGEFNTKRLSEDLVAQFPQLVSGGVAQFFTQYNGDTLTLTLPDDIDVRAVGSIIDEHDPKALSHNQRRAAEAPARRVSIDAKLKAIGLTADELKFLFDYIQEEARR